MDKTLPSSPEMERAVLGALMLEKSALPSVVDFLTPDCFYDSKYNQVFRGVISLYEKSKPIDLRTVNTWLKSQKSTVTAYDLSNITAAVSSAANVEYHARILKEHALRREGITIGTRLANACFDLSQDVFLSRDKAENDLSSDADTGGMVDSKRALADLSEDMEGRISGKITSLPSGIPALDHITMGFQKSDLIIIGARPGMGKTAFALKIARHLSLESGLTGVLFSMEMSKVQIMRRLVAAETGIPVNSLIQPGEGDLTEMLDKSSRIAEMPLLIDDTSALTLLAMKGKLKRISDRNLISYVLVDYLQLMAQRGSNREQEVSKLVQGLKQIAKEMNIPIIAFSQLSRKVEDRGGDKRPQLSDLRDSGDIEQAANMAIFLYRAEYYGITHLEDGTPTYKMIEFLVQKNRDGEIGNAMATFIPETMDFVPFTEDYF